MTSNNRGRKRDRDIDESYVNVGSDPETLVPIESSSVTSEAIEQATIFHDYDFTNFWVNCKQSREKYEEPIPTLDQIRDIESVLGFKLPAAYIELCQTTRNGGLLKKTEINAGEYQISGILSIGKTKISSLGGAYGSQYSIEECNYPDIGVYFGECPSAGHDMICLDYSQCGPLGEPQVVHIDQECDYHISVIAKDFETFIRQLEYNTESTEIPQDEVEHDSDDQDDDIETGSIHEDKMNPSKRMKKEENSTFCIIS